MIDPVFLGNVQPVGPPAQSGAPQQTEGDFSKMLLDALDEVNRLQTEADQGVQDLLTGKSDNVAEVFAAANKAGIAFDMLMEIRNKLIDAYRDIQQIRV